MKPLPFGSRRVGVLGGPEPPAAGCALWSTALHPRALQFWVFLVLFSDMCWLERGEGEAVELPFLPREGLLVLGRGRRRPPWRKGGMPTASWDLRR